MEDKFDKAIEDLLNIRKSARSQNDNLYSGDVLKITQSILNLAHARNILNNTSMDDVWRERSELESEKSKLRREKKEFYRNKERSDK